MEIFCVWIEKSSSCVHLSGRRSQLGKSPTGNLHSRIFFSSFFFTPAHIENSALLLAWERGGWRKIHLVKIRTNSLFFAKSFLSFFSLVHQSTSRSMKTKRVGLYRMLIMHNSSQRHVWARYLNPLFWLISTMRVISLYMFITQIVIDLHTQLTKKRKYFGDQNDMWSSVYLPMKTAGALFANKWGKAPFAKWQIWEAVLSTKAVKLAVCFNHACWIEITEKGIEQTCWNFAKGKYAK